MLANIISEIGDIPFFETADQLTSWAGLAPSSHSSGRKVINGSIGKTGNRYMRGVLIQIAHAAVKTLGSVLGSVPHACDEAQSISYCHRGNCTKRFLRSFAIYEQTWNLMRNRV
ncbi:MAG: IS110 family transposase [Euryarchaeota archaeon]|nr:IS110 family transposase [Euryarchaeota archaeon]